VRLVLLAMSLLIMTFANQAHAWWNNPYGYFPGRTGYWPSVWPAYVQPRYGNAPQGNVPFGGWNVKGTMNQRGDAHFVIEYHGNIYNMQYGNGYGYPAFQGYPGFPGNGNMMNGWQR